MSYKAHTLNSNHSHIIGRTDPITGDTVKENDRVVFCAVCKSCFLKESWIYMGGQHCEQAENLKELPKLSSRLNIKNRSNEIIAEVKDSMLNLYVVGITLFSFIFSILLLGTSEMIIAQNMMVVLLVSLFITFFVALLSPIIISQDKVRSFLGDELNDIRLFMNRIEIGKDSFSWNDIEQIKYQREVDIVVYDGNRVQVYPSAPYILVYFKNGKFTRFLSPTKNYDLNKNLIIGMGKIAHLTEVFFYTEDLRELRLMQNIRQRRNENIEIGYPNRLYDRKGNFMLDSVEI
ncbi:hypothetical protein [Bernardetia sp.]|uniref:hypothetical protein n=1 Tax=Bernardetia sp. TaxID=1937974 RepID=UPI0025B85F01|nr:hypothetical protein [Bernardetia sp.]